MGLQKAPKLFRVRTAEDLDRIPFEDGMAAVEVPSDLLDKLELKNADRGTSLRLRALERSIRERGFSPMEPITARIGRRGRWVVVDGGHRLTAARHVMREFWTNLFGRKVETFYFILFLNPDSWSKTAPPKGVALPNPDGVEDPEKAASWQRAWDRVKRAGRDPS